VNAKGGCYPRAPPAAVVFVYRDDAGYEVEFIEPFHCVATVERGEIRRIGKPD
jgi:hypothetical protein